MIAHAGYLTGLTIKRLAATVNRYGKELDLNANILVEYENGVNGAYWCSQIAAGNLNGLCVRIYGNQGALEWQQHYPDYVKYTPKGKPTQLLSRGCGYIAEEAGAYSRLPAGHPEGFIEAFANIYRNFTLAVMARESGDNPGELITDFPTVYDGVRGMQFVEMMVQSGGDNHTKWQKWIE